MTFVIYIIIRRDIPSLSFHQGNLTKHLLNHLEKRLVLVLKAWQILIIKSFKCYSKAGLIENIGMRVVGLTFQIFNQVVYK